MATQTTTKTTSSRPANGQDTTPSIISESAFTTEGQILDGQIRSQKIQQKKHELRGNIAKTERKKLWADTEETKRDIQADDLDTTKQMQVLNRDAHVQNLANKSYKTELTRGRNNGLRQKLINEGGSINIDHTQAFSAALRR